MMRIFFLNIGLEFVFFALKPVIQMPHNGATT